MSMSILIEEITKEESTSVELPVGVYYFYSGVDKILLTPSLMGVVIQTVPGGVPLMYYMPADFEPYRAQREAPTAADYSSTTVIAETVAPERHIAITSAQEFMAIALQPELVLQLNKDKLLT